MAIVGIDKPTKESQVEREINRLNNKLDITMEAVKSLRQKLCSVIRDEPTVVKQQEVTSALVPLANAIMLCSDRVEIILNEVTTLRENCEL